MAQIRLACAWGVGLLVVVVGLALVPLPAVAGDECVLPGDGVDGPPLDYQVKSNGTIRDRNTELIWERKLAADNQACTALVQADCSVRCVNNFYTWTDTSTAPDGTLFTDFLAKLNNRCEKDETKSCTSKADCAPVGGKCGFAGKRDWRIPNVKELQSIVDYGVFNPAIDATFPGETAAGDYWSSTTYAVGSSGAWSVFFADGFVDVVGKANPLPGRAVRGGR